MKLKTIYEDNEVNVPGDYTLEDFLSEFDEPMVYCSGETPYAEGEKFAKFPCVLSIDNQWIHRTWEDCLGDDKILSSIYIFDGKNDDAIRTRLKSPYNTEPKFVAYNPVKLGVSRLKKIGEAIEKTIGYDEYFKKLLKESSRILSDNESGIVVLW